MFGYHNKPKTGFTRHCGESNRKEARMFWEEVDRISRHCESVAEYCDRQIASFLDSAKADMIKETDMFAYNEQFKFAVREYNETFSGKSDAPDWKTAAEKSYRERWLPVARAHGIDEMHEAYYEIDNCALCLERDKYHLDCVACPLVRCTLKLDGISLWGVYRSAYIDNDFFAAHEAALAMCDRLCEIAGIEGEHRKSEVPDWWKDGWWVRGMSTALNIHKIGEQDVTMYEYWREPTLDDLSFTRKDVKMWAWETGNEGEMRVSTYSDATVAKYGSFAACFENCNGYLQEDYILLKALIGDAPIIPWEQWKYLTEKEGK